jgi:competence protein ComEA
MKFKTIRELFHFTRKERIGIIVLLCIIFILLAINVSLPYLVENKPVDTSDWEAEVKQYLNRQEIVEQQTADKELKQFDPNKITYSELTDMGVPDRVASNWKKYLEKGGHFKEPRDIGKIYGMTAELFDRMESSIAIPHEIKDDQILMKLESGSVNYSYQGNKVINNKKSLLPKDSVELNLADSTGLENLPGIGPILAARIIRYRNLLGGFYSVNQLREVYGLREEHYLAATPYLYVNVESIRRFNINFASISELGRHPYIGFRTARRIIKLRDEKGKYSSKKDLSAIMAADSVERLSPYLKFIR